MKSKLDLNNLLAKYEGISSNSANNYYSPAKDYDPPIQEQFYQSRTKNPEVNYQRRPYVENVSSNFQMSKSECHQFLEKVRQQLKIEASEMNFYAQGAMKRIHEDFKRQHDMIKRELLELLDRAFLENQRRIRQELAKQGKLEPPQFAAVRRKIATHQETIDRLLQELRGPDYRKGIADTVLHDFTVEINQLRTSIKSAKDDYLSNFGQVEPDRERINCIKDDLHRLFRISKKNANLVQKVFFEALGQKPSEKKQSGLGFAEDKPSHPPSERQRKSFFNFGSD